MPNLYQLTDAKAQLNINEVNNHKSNDRSGHTKEDVRVNTACMAGF